jgi:molybdenum cofactor cytidylyltransferase
LRTGAVVLAAGRSSRMGANKLLLDVSGRTVLDRLLDALAYVDEVVVVTGYNPEPIRKIAEAHEVRVAHNLDHEKGMTTSFKTGIRALGDVDAAFLILGDQLGLRPELIRRMEAAIEDVPCALIVSPMHDGRRGHPVLFRGSLFREILAVEGSLKDVVDAHAGEHVHVEGGEWSTLDFDTPADFERAKRLYELGRE